MTESALLLPEGSGLLRVRIAYQRVAAPGMVGYVEAADPALTAFRVGDAVLAPDHLPEGTPIALCGARDLTLLPERISLQAAAALAGIGPRVMAALEKSPAGKSALIPSLDAAGAFAVAVLAQRGYREIAVLTDLADEEKRNLVYRLGATRVLSPGEPLPEADYTFDPEACERWSPASMEAFLDFMREHSYLFRSLAALATCYAPEEAAKADAGDALIPLLRFPPTPLTKDDLKAGFARLGLKPGMKVMVHSALSSFGRVKGGAETVVDALMETLTPEGTLVMPSFNHEAPYYEGKIYDVRETPTTNGAIPDAFWRRPGVCRSINPTHAFAAWGKDAERYTKDHQATSAMGPDSPLGRLMEDGGYCVLIGVFYNSNTFHHHVETCEGAPCLALRGEEFPVRLADGTETLAHTWSWRSKGCPINDRARYAPRMAAIDTQCRIGDSTVILYKLSEGYPIIARGLHEGLDGFPPCSQCPTRPRVCQWTVSPGSSTPL